MANPQSEDSSRNTNITGAQDLNGDFKPEFSDQSPPQLLLLPKDLSKDARIISLKHPRGCNDTYYLVCPIKGVYELRTITESESTRRSLFLYPNHKGETRGNETDELKTHPNHNGYIMRNASLFVATLIDPLFLILPSLVPPINTKSSAHQKSLYLSFDDYLDRLITDSPRFVYLTNMIPIRRKLFQRMIAVCDSVDVDDEKMYRLNEGELAKELIRKALRMTEGGLPPSIEEKFIKKALEVPATKETFENNCKSDSPLVEEKKKGENLSVKGDQLKKIDPLPSMIRSVDDEPTTNMTLINSELLSDDHLAQKLIYKDEVSDLLRLKTCLLFIISNYITPHMGEFLKNLLFVQNSVISFISLENHLTKVAKLRQDAVNARFNDDYSRKRVRPGDDDSETRAEKRKKEDKLKKSVSCSRGVNALKKANISGMKKMSEFFKKS